MIAIGSTEISKVCLGSNELSKVYIGSTEVWSAAQDYVKNGLVYWFDGINKGNDDTKWTDLVSNAFFTYTTHSSVSDDAVVVDGAGYLTGSTTMKIGQNTGTIEVCAERTDGKTTSAVLFVPASNGDYLAFIISGSGFVFAVASSSNQYQITKPTLWTASMSSERAIVNGTVYTTKTNNNWGGSSTNATLGGRNSGNAYYFGGKIHAIRIYNRHLTEAEMRNNQRMDNIRFNLGLNLE